MSFLSAVAVVSLVACGGGQSSSGSTATVNSETKVSEENTENVNGTDVNDDTDSANKNILIAYFTVPEADGVDTVASASRVATDDTVMGNTEYMAKAIQSAVGGDLFAIETEQEYPETHDELLNFAYGELMRDDRPALASEIENFDGYEVIFIGYPNWNADLPMPMYTFFEEYDFSGKTIIPFVTHGGSGFSGTVKTIKELEPEANVIDDGLSVSRNSVANSYDKAAEWALEMIKD